MIKITSKLLSELPEGVFYVDKNLFIRTRNGKQAYLFIYRFNKKKHELRIGDASLITPAMARAKAIEFRSLLEQGIDPYEVRHRKRMAESTADKLFKDFAPEAIEKIAETKQWRNEKSLMQWTNTIEAYALPVIGNMVLREIKREDIIEVLQPIWKQKTETASRLRGRIEAIFDLAIVMGYYDGPNPATWRGNLSFFLPPITKVQKVRHHDALTFDELKTFFSERFEQKVVHVSTQAVLFGALTATRANEFIEMTWDEVDFEKKVWTIPAERRKDGKPYPHRIPLSDQAILVLERMEKSNRFVFAKASGVGHISKETPRVIILKRFKHGTMHGCRSTFSDWATENGWSDVLREKSLMHATGNEVSQAYQRSDLLEQRRPLMQAWADALTFDLG